MKTVKLNVKYIKHRMVDLDIDSRVQLARVLNIHIDTVRIWFTKERIIPQGIHLGRMLEVFDCGIADLLEVVEVIEDD